MAVTKVKAPVGADGAADWQRFSPSLSSCSQPWLTACRMSNAIPAFLLAVVLPTVLVAAPIGFGARWLVNRWSANDD